MVMLNFLVVLPVFEFFARSGGGGSSSSGGGGGSLLFFIGYIPAYFFTKFMKKIAPRPFAFGISIAFSAVFTVFALIVGILSASASLFFLVGIVIFGIWSGWGAAMFSLWDKMSKRFKKADDDLKKAGWNEDDLKRVASTAFLRYQDDWSRRDPSRFLEYMTPYYATHAALMVRALTELHRYDLMQNVQILKMDTDAVYDNPDDTQDFFSILIEAKANDVLMDETQKTLYTDNNSFIEEWTFQRGNNTWLLAGIRQTTEAPQMLEADLKQFAETNHMFYSLDMGWLFLPARGDIFNNGKWLFGYGDINNHVIGAYNNHLIQLYTYVRSENGQKDNFKNYLVGQIALPKEYGGILIERKKGIFNRVFAPKGYQKYEFEWPDFNERYNVYATDQSRLAAFELLNPGFMAFLYDNFNDVSMEVVDNVVYFYALKTGMRNDYEQLLQLLMRAFKELQL